jgi:hypothetical protein
VLSCRTKCGQKVTVQTLLLVDLDNLFFEIFIAYQAPGGFPFLEGIAAGRG